MVLELSLLKKLEAIAVFKSENLTAEDITRLGIYSELKEKRGGT